MAVQARFYIASTTRLASLGYADPKPAGQVRMQAVTRGEANAVWASSTPHGEMTMTVKSPAFAWFEERIGKEISITLDDAPEDEPK